MRMGGHPPGVNGYKQQLNRKIAARGPVLDIFRDSPAPAALSSAGAVFHLHNIMQLDEDDD
jgi:hypothetical protein